jgi:hypothetical protein
MIRKILKLTCSLGLLALFPVWLWAALAIAISGPMPGWPNNLFAILFTLLLPTILFLKGCNLRAFFLIICCLGLFSLWWQTIVPKGDKEWTADVARISYGEIKENKLTMFNVRNFDYRAEDDFTVLWENKEYDMGNLKGLDIYLSYWASEHIAHVILSWDFGSDGQLAISIETRKDTSQEYSALKGFFKQFELAYVAATEEDIIKLRTHYRKERVYLYRLLVEKKRVRALLESYLEEMARLRTEPTFYNALTRNCSTSVQLHANASGPEASGPMNWRLLASGHLDELLYMNEIISTDSPFADIRKKSRINPEQIQPGEESFSYQIRKEEGELSIRSTN